MSLNIDETTFRQLIDLHNLYRLRIVNEDALVHNRLSWFLTSEVALFVLWSAILSQAIEVPLLAKVLLIMLIGGSGIAIGIASMLAVTAAYKEIERISALYTTDVLPRFKDAAIPLPGLKGDEPLHWHALHMGVAGRSDDRLVPDRCHRPRRRRRRDGPEPGADVGPDSADRVSRRRPPDLTATL